MAERTPERNARDKQTIIECVASGEPVTKVLERLGIDGTTYARWMRDDLEFAASLAAARELQAEHMADKLLTLHDDIEDPRKARVASDNIRWLLERRHRKTYGASVDVNVNASISVTAALAEARNRLVRPICDPKIIDVTPNASDSKVSESGASDYQSEQAELIPDLSKVQTVWKVPFTGQVPNVEAVKRDSSED